jgi:hypothetical protein
VFRDVISSFIVQNFSNVSEKHTSSVSKIKQPTRPINCRGAAEKYMLLHPRKYSFTVVAFQHPVALTYYLCTFTSILMHFYL